MGCCCGCPGTTCANCTGKGDAAELVSASGITIDPTDTCYDTFGGLHGAHHLRYSGSTQDFSSCIVQETSGLVAGCAYSKTSNITDLFTPAATFLNTTDAACPGTGSFVTLTTLAYLILTSGTYTLTIMGYNAALGRFPVYFMGTLSVSSPPCKISTLTFTNAISPGTLYLVPYFNGSGGVFMAAFGSGGTAVVSFKQSCCP